MRPAPARVLFVVPALLVLDAAGVAAAGPGVPDRGYLADVFVDARAAGTGATGIAAVDGPFSVFGNPASLGAGDRSHLGVVGSSLFEELIDDAEVWRGAAATTIGPVGLGLGWSRLRWGEVEIRPDPFLDALRLDPDEEELRLGVGVGVFAREPGEHQTLRLRVGGALHRHRLRVAPPDDVGESGLREATRHSVSLGARASWAWIPSERAASSWPLRGVGLRLGMVWSDPAEPSAALGTDDRVALAAAVRVGLEAEVELGSSPLGGALLGVRLGHERGEARLLVPDVGGSTLRTWYVELRLLGVLSLRRGWVEDAAYGVDDTTTGLGLVLAPERWPWSLHVDWGRRPLARLPDDGSVVLDRFADPTAGGRVLDEDRVVSVGLSLDGGLGL